jgi:hypothetical protein
MSAFSVNMFCFRHFASTYQCGIEKPLITFCQRQNHWNYEHMIINLQQRHLLTCFMFSMLPQYMTKELYRKSSCCFNWLLESPKFPSSPYKLQNIYIFNKKKICKIYRFSRCEKFLLFLTFCIKFFYSFFLPFFMFFFRKSKILCKWLALYDKQFVENHKAYTCLLKTNLFHLLTYLHKSLTYSWK